MAQTIDLDVSFKLTDIDYKPLANVPVRLVFGSDKDWQNKDAGYKFTTDAKGEATLQTKVILDKVFRKIPTNYIDSLFSLPLPRQHLIAAAELEYMNLPALYAVDIVCLPGGTTMQDDFYLYSRDQDGNFSRRVQPREYGTLRPDLVGYVLQGPGYEPWDYSLLPFESDPPGQHWGLKLAFKRSKAPVKL